MEVTITPNNIAGIGYYVGTTKVDDNSIYFGGTTLAFNNDQPMVIPAPNYPPTCNWSSLPPTVDFGRVVDTGRDKSTKIKDGDSIPLQISCVGSKSPKAGEATVTAFTESTLKDYDLITLFDAGLGVKLLKPAATADKVLDPIGELEGHLRVGTPAAPIPWWTWTLNPSAGQTVTSEPITITPELWNIASPWPKPNGEKRVTITLNLTTK